MNLITVPTPDQLRQRIADCEEELRELRRLLRMSLAMSHATEARRRRTPVALRGEASRGR
jgi:hypothetical protein